jgi:septal ring factor EnvC (AmiA/AmiB activator)
LVVEHPAAVEAKHAAEATLTCAQSELNTTQAKVESQQSEIDALNLQLMAMQCERNHSDTLPVTEDTTHRRSDTSHVEDCPSCARSRSVISALRERLGEEFGDDEVRFLRKLNATNNVDELVAVLCERLNTFTQALYKELLPLHKNKTNDIEAERRSTKASIADYVQKLGESRCKESRLEHQLAEARSDLSEALDKLKKT